jgi:hypothetical protein
MATVKARPDLAPGLGPGVVLVTGLAAAGALLVNSASQLWFFGDDWDFLLTRGTVPGADLGLFVPHNEHWSTIPILIFRAIFAMVGLRQYLPYALPVIAAHLGVVVLMYLLLVRFGTSRWVAVSVSLFLAFLGAGAQNTLWDFQIGFVGAVFFGLAAMWLYDRHDQGGWRLSFVWVAMVLGLMCSGIALGMLGAVCAYAAARRGLARAAVVGSVPLAVYAAWYLGWGRFAIHQVVSDNLDYLKVPNYVWTAFTSAWERSSGIPGSGAVIVSVLIGAALLARSTPARLRHFAWAGLAGALAQFVLAGASRIQFGVGQASSSRYAYVVSVLMAPALAVVLQLVADRLTEPRWVSTCLVVAMAALVVVNGVLLTLGFMVARRAQVVSMPERVLGVASLVTKGALVLSTTPDPLYNRNIKTYLLASPQIQAALPAASVGEAGLLEAAALIEVGVSRTRLPIPPAQTATLISGFVGTSAVLSSCQDYRATVSKPVIGLPPTSTGSQIRITGAMTSVTTVLRRGSLTSSPVSWPARPGSTVFVGTSTPDASLQIILYNGGTVTLCT